MHAIPIPFKEGPTTLRADAILTATGVASVILDVSTVRQLTLLCSVAPADTGNTPQVLVLLGGGSSGAPAATDDVWYGPNEYDGSNARATMGGTVLPGAGFTITPGAAIVKAAPLMIRFDTFANASDRLRIAVPVRIDWATWLQEQCWDVGTGTLATLGIVATRSI